MNIAIVDPYISGRYLAQTLSEHQINSIAILTNTSVAEKMQLSGRLNPASFTHLVYLENYKQDDLIRHLVSLDIDMLIAGTEYVIEEAETLSTQLGLKYGNPLITLPLRKNKSSILKHLGAENIGMPASEYINLHDEKIAQTVQRIATTLRFPLFIKPCSAGGSFGIKRCNNLAELDRAILDLRSKQYGLSNETVKTAIVQEFIDAPEYSLNAVSYAGKHYITGVWLYEKSYHDGDIPCYVEANLVNLAPSMRQTIQAFVDDSLNALEWQYGFSHIEFFWHQNKPVMVEVNFRLPGVFGFLCNLEKSAYGDDQVTILNKLIKKNEVAHHNLHPQGKARILFLSNRIPYTVPTFSPEAFHKIESVVLFRQNIISGSSMPPAKSLSDCILYIGLYNEDERQLNRDTQLINDLLNRNYGLQ